MKGKLTCNPTSKQTEIGCNSVSVREYFGSEGHRYIALLEKILGHTRKYCQHLSLSITRNNMQITLVSISSSSSHPCMYQSVQTFTFYSICLFHVEVWWRFPGFCFCSSEKKTTISYVVHLGHSDSKYVLLQLPKNFHHT